MVPALVLFDWIVRRRRIEDHVGVAPAICAVHRADHRLSHAALPSCFHEAARESLLSAQRVHDFLSDSSRHLVRLIFGGPGIRRWVLRDTMFMALGAGMVAAIGWRLSRSAARVLWRTTIYFGVIWIVLGVLPILMSGYYSPRHMYLASLGWAVTLGVGLEIIWRAQPARVLRPIGVAAAGALALVYAVQLGGIVSDWRGYAANFSCRRTTTWTRGGRLSRRGTRHRGRSAIELGVCGSALRSGRHSCPTKSRSGCSSSPTRSIIAATRRSGNDIPGTRFIGGTRRGRVRLWWRCTGMRGQAGCHASPIATIRSFGRWPRS
jgi:hypothetical protein